mgnify:CR=1 FL=1
MESIKDREVRPLKAVSWQLKLALLLVLASAAVYYLHFRIFHDVHHIFLYLIGDIAFVFVEVLMVTLVLEGLLSARDKKEKLQKLNMVIGAFFSEVGEELLVRFTDADAAVEPLRERLIVSGKWTPEQFAATRTDLAAYKPKLELADLDLQALKGFLNERRGFLQRLLENPNLLEHDTFTDLLWAVFHLTEELVHREGFDALPPSDIGHLRGDIGRAYSALLVEWLAYMQHLKTNYPYLFSLALRINPFDRSASVVVKE